MTIKLLFIVAGIGCGMTNSHGRGVLATLHKTAPRFEPVQAGSCKMAQKILLLIIYNYNIQTGRLELIGLKTLIYCASSSTTQNVTHW